VRTILIKTPAPRQSRLGGTIGTVTDASASPPPGYHEPTVAWMVEYTDARESGARFQAGAFTTEAEAQKLLNQLGASRSVAEMWINVVPVHRTVEDWQWDQ
jgi:hypothetical protein